MTFTITEQHLRLLRGMYVEWQDIETGAPAIDPKRPYGNSDVEFDVLQDLGIEPAERGEVDARYWPQGYPEWSDAQREWAAKLHRETEYALQICLKIGAFTTGTFKRTSEYDTASWVMA
jgi:hypothetical protein